MRAGERSMGWKLGMTGLLLLATLLGAYFLLPHDREAAPSALRVGAGDDITGILLSEVSSCAQKEGEEELLVGSYLFVDCCASAAQWALQAQEIDLGFYCAQAAMEMVNQTSDFEIYSPIIMNGEVLACLGDPEEIGLLGIPRKRSFLESIVQASYPQVEEFCEINRPYLPLSLEAGEVDGVLLDVSDAARSEEGFRFLPASETSYISYCMVVRKDIEETDAFQRFLEYYQDAVDRLNDPDRLVELMGKDEAFWTGSKLEFLHTI